MTGNTWHISRIYWAAVHPAKYAGTIRAPRQTFPAAQSRLPSLEGSGEPAGGSSKRDALRALNAQLNDND